MCCTGEVIPSPESEEDILPYVILVSPLVYGKTR